MVPTIYEYQYASPIYPGIYPHLAVILALSGFLLLAWLVILEVTWKEGVKTRSFAKEAMMTLFASVFVGLGVMFSMLSVGIYV